MQTTSSVLMVRPSNFRFNAETASNNFYQEEDFRSTELIQNLALAEFDNLVLLLRMHGINVVAVDDSHIPIKPDAVFPNNWLSMHDDGKLILYPIFSQNRRGERRKEIVELLIRKGFLIHEIIDLSFFEESQQYLESTGSMVLDHSAHIIYACRSIRTHLTPLSYLAKILDYRLILFDAIQEINGYLSPIYHTNVMMHVGTEFAIVCLDSMPRTAERLLVQKTLVDSGKKIIPITIKQKNNFAANVLELRNDGGESFTILSQRAIDSLNLGQILQIESVSNLIIAPVPTIEKIGGGGVRCMMAEIFLPLSK